MISYSYFSWKPQLKQVVRFALRYAMPYLFKLHSDSDISDVSTLTYVRKNDACYAKHDEDSTSAIDSVYMDRCPLHCPDHLEHWAHEAECIWFAYSNDFITFCAILTSSCLDSLYRPLPIRVAFRSSIHPNVCEAENSMINHVFHRSHMSWSRNLS